MNFKTLFATSATLALMAVSAQAEFTQAGTITRSFDFNGQTTTVAISPEIALNGSKGLIEADIRARMDASDLQADLTNLMNQRWKHDECGQRLNTNNATIRPDGDALFVGLTAQAQLWECVKTKLPKIRMVHKCLLKAFGKCRASTHVPETYWEIEEIKTKLISQSVRLEARITPLYKDGSLTAEVQVTKAMPSGLAGDLVGIFGVQGKIRDLVQKQVAAKVADYGVSLPPQVMDYHPEVKDIDFVDLGGGRLGLDVEASGAITQEQVVGMLMAQLD